MHKIIILFAAAAAVVMTACRHGDDRQSDARQQPLLTVGTATAEVRSVPQRMNFTGRTAGLFDVVIQPRVTGYLKSIRFDDGMPVRKGQLLFTIDARDISASVSAAEAQLYSARAQEAEARSNYERAVPLARINAISQVQLEQYATLQSSAEAAVRSAEATLSKARLNYGYTDIYAPAGGIIARTQAHEGDLVGPDTQFDKLTSISCIDTVTVDLMIPVAEYMRYSGRRADTYDNDSLLTDIVLTLADGTRYPHKGAYRYTRRDVSAPSGAMVVVVGFPNPRYALKPGQFARVSCDVGPSRRAVCVPPQAVSTAQGVSSVWIVRGDDTVEYRRVETDGTADGWQIITVGLSGGERVATSGLQKLHNGMKVELDN